MGMEMVNAQRDAVPQSDERYRALLAVAEAITLHRDLGGLFHDLADCLHDVVRFDWLPTFEIMNEDRMGNDPLPCSWPKQ